TTCALIIKAADRELCTFLNGDVVNRNSNYDERFWTPVAEEIEDELVLVNETKKTQFCVETRLRNLYYVGGALQAAGQKKKAESYVGEEWQTRDRKSVV